MIAAHHSVCCEVWQVFRGGLRTKSGRSRRSGRARLASRAKSADAGVNSVASGVNSGRIHATGWHLGAKEADAGAWGLDRRAAQ
eukprot:899283-Prorocentrum_minimum.AAC.2